MRVWHALVLPLVRALFEDEAGNYDWLFKGLGEPTAVRWAEGSSKRAYVSSTMGAVAAVALKDGGVEWRRTTPGNSPVKGLVVSKSALLSLSENGALYAWKAANGNLQWQMDAYNAVQSAAFMPSGAEVFVVTSKTVDLRSSRNGAPVWQVEASSVLGDHKSRFQAGALGEDGRTAFVVATDKKTTTVLKLDAADGKTSDKTVLDAAAPSDPGSFLVVGRFLVYLDTKGGAVHSIDMANPKTPSKMDLPTHTDTFDSLELVSEAQSSTLATLFTVSGSKTSILVRAGDQGLSNVQTGGRNTLCVVVEDNRKGASSQEIALVTVEASSTVVTTLGLDGGSQGSFLNAPGLRLGSGDEPQRFGAAHAAARITTNGDRQALVVTQDHALALMSGEDLVWLREEAMAEARQALFFGNAVLTQARRKAVATATEAKTGPSSILQWAADIASDPDAAVQWGLRRKDALVNGATALTQNVMSYLDPSPPKRRGASTVIGQDKTVLPIPPASGKELKLWGATQVALLATCAGKVMAVNVASGTIAWQRLIAPTTDVKGCLSKESGSGIEIHLLPSAADPKAQALIVAPGAGGATLMWVNPSTGKLIHKQAAPGDGFPTSITAAPTAKSPDQTAYPVFLVGADGKPTVAPSPSDVVKPPAGAPKSELYTYKVLPDKGSMEGFMVADGGQGALVPIWNVDFAATNEVVVSLTTPMHSEWGMIPVHVKGDASALFRYLNPNMLAVITEPKIVKEDHKSLTLYLIDGVSGRVLHTSYISRASTPVHVVTCENWVGVHYWSVDNARYEIYVLDLFESKKDDGPWDLVFGKGNANHTFSAHQLETPVALTQTYIVPFGVSALGVTATERGVTPRSLLFALPSNQLYALPKELLNARRPVKTGEVVGDVIPLPSQFAPSKDEMIVPYKAVLGNSPTEVISYDLAIEGVRGIATAPTQRESTSLALAYGMDVFFTTVQPVKGFDILAPDFNYPVLSISLVVIVSAVLVTNAMVDRKHLDDRWK
mmetsp:Transcript_40293/g.96618  ORF Transcript_40293/g.96618 Transcript_40293/m.96618 type:complete len:1007 (-) Transcript_40293:36-3056(-)